MVRALFCIIYITVKIVLFIFCVFVFCKYRFIWNWY